MMQAALSSEADLLRSLPSSEREEMISRLSDEQAAHLCFDWSFWARPAQLPPAGAWRTWLLKSGRGFGKTRAGAEYIRSMVEAGKAKYIALVAPTAADARDVMAEGESGLLNICPPWNRPTYEPSKRRITWKNGARATLYSADEPDRLRGPQHDLAWCDEVSSWRYPEAWDMLMFGLRLGDDPRVVVTTTPKPNKITKDLIRDKNTAITSGSTFDNSANLAPAFLSQIVAKYEGTRLGRQELEGEILDDVQGALWKLVEIDELRRKKHPELQRIVVAVDPAVSSNEESDETGIVVCGLGEDGHGYVLEDLSGIYTPEEWANRVLAAYDRHQADCIVAEINNGGELVKANIKAARKNFSYNAVRASRGKQVRAEPVSNLYKQGKIHHIGSFAGLEDQMCNWVQGSKDSPDRMDAAVWGFFDLFKLAEDDEPEAGILLL